MRTQSINRVTLSGIALLATVTSFACVDEQIVFRDRELFTDPPIASQGMLGYTDAETKLTVCGNCHVSFQGEWEQTLHAKAWDDLQDSGHASESCEGCHTVNERGNLLSQPAGHSASPEERYYDVQCESCHGPGLGHVNDPDNVKPLASIAVGVDLESGCGECHSGAHNPFVEQWAASRHGEGASRPQYRDREGCESCHGGKAALLAWGENAPYLEKDDPSSPQGITCAVCHDPHDKTNEKQLRFPIGVQDIDQNLCMKCHQRRAIPDEASSRGPHSPQGPLLLGEVGTVG